MLVWLIAVGCAEKARLPVGPEGVAVESLEVRPAVAEALTGPGGGLPVQFEAWVTYEGQTEAVPADLVEWSLSNLSVGEIDEAGLFVPGLTNGGVSWVTARLAGAEGQSTLTVRFQDDRVEGDADPSRLEGATFVESPLWLYPQDGVNLPRNTPSLLFQWADPLPELPVHTWRVRVRSAISDVSIYTRATETVFDEATWQTLAATNAGGTITVELSGAGDGVAWAAPPREVTVNRFDARGAIYYWSTSVAGILRTPYGAAPEPYLTQAGTGRCVACHVVSSTGRMAVTFDGGNAPMGVYDMEAGAFAGPGNPGQTGNFKAFSPDGRFLLSTYQGGLFLHDGETGDLLGSVPLAETVTMPDWSPDGTRVVLVATDPARHGLDWSFGGGRLVVLDHLGDGQFGGLSELWAPPAGLNVFYPAWSPDGAWVAFNLSAGDSYDDADAALYLVSGEGGAPVELAAANLGAGLTNSWPRWGPLPDDDILWLAFSSKRAYGAVTAGNPQIWVTAVDPARAAAGEDPSWPAFWLPGQEPAQNNHIPVWAE